MKKLMAGAAREERKRFSRIGFSFLALMAIYMGSSVVLGLVMGRLAQFPGAQGFAYIIGYACLYGVAFPVAILIAKKVPVGVNTPIIGTGASWFGLFLMCFCLSYLGGTAGNAVSGYVAWISGGGFYAVTPATQLTGTEGFYQWIYIMVIVVVAPVVEELFFRKVLIDRLQRYGQLFAVIVTAILFGLYHANLVQLISGLLMGLALGYVYLSTGKIGNTIAIHALNNLFGMTGSVLLATGGLFVAAILGYLILAFVIAGGVKLISYRKRIRLDIRLLALPQTGWGKIVLGNPGMILGLASAITVYVLNLIAVSKI